MENREVIIIDANIENTEKLKVAAYARVSTNSQEQEESFINQVSHYTTLIQANEQWVLVDVYADEGITGTSTKKRADFNRMINDCRKGKIDRIITKSISRFARNAIDTITYVRELKLLGISILFESENIDTLELNSESILSLYSMVAEQGSISISKNVKKGIRMGMKQGTYLPTHLPYGYYLNKKDIHINTKEAEIVKRIFSEYINGKGSHIIAKELTEENIQSPERGKKWYSNTILSMIRNEKYIGNILYQKTMMTDTIPYKCINNQGELPKYYVANTHKAIVEKDVFDKANNLLASTSKERTEYKEYVFSKKIVCGECGTLYKRKITNSKVYWVCRKHDTKKELCESRKVAEERIENAFIRMYTLLSEHKKTIIYPLKTLLLKVKQEKEKSNTKVLEINEKIARLYKQNQVINSLLNDGILDSAIFTSKSDEMNKELNTLKKEKLYFQGGKENLVLEKTSELINLLNREKPKHTIQKEIFERIVKKIIINKDDTVIFILINELALKERL